MVVALLFAKLVSLRGILVVAGLVLLGAGLVMSGAPVFDPIVDAGSGFVDDAIDWLTGLIGDQVAPW